MIVLLNYFIKRRRTWMKRIFTVLIIAGLLFSVSLAQMAAQETGQPEMLTVAHTTMLNGNFFSDLWGNNTADIDVRSLLHGYPLVAQTIGGKYQLDQTVIEGLDRIEEENGDITYRVMIKKGLVYSDGSPIGAKDYLFSFLLLSSPQVRALTV